MMGDWVGIARYSSINDCIADAAKFHEKMSSMHAQLFLFNKEREVFKFDYGPSYGKYFNLVAETPYAALYEVK